MKNYYIIVGTFVQQKEMYMIASYKLLVMNTETAWRDA